MILVASVLGVFFLPAAESCSALLLLGCPTCCSNLHASLLPLYSYSPQSSYASHYTPYRPAYSSYVPAIGALPQQHYVNYAPNPARQQYPTALLAPQKTVALHRHYFSRTNPLSYPNLVNSSYSIVPTYIKQLNAGYARPELQVNVLPTKTVLIPPHKSIVPTPLDSSASQTIQLTNAISFEAQVSPSPKTKEIEELVEEVIASVTPMTQTKETYVTSTQIIETSTEPAYNTNQLVEENKEEVEETLSDDDIETTTSFIFPEFTFNFPSITDTETTTTTTASPLAISIAFIPEPELKIDTGSFLTFFQNGELIGKEPISSQAEMRNDLDKGPEYIVDGGKGDGEGDIDGLN